jgi:glycosyltransferase involved in cell wall biosynthesis
MGITPTLPLHLPRQRLPDVAHVFGFRDPLGTALSLWCRRRGIPYVFEALGMFEPKLRKVRLKQILDTTVTRHVAHGAARLIAASRIECREYLARGVSAERIALRPNGFPAVPSNVPSGGFRRRLGLDANSPLVLSVGRVARGKGLELLLDAVRDLPDVHLAIVGPDDGHGMVERLRAQSVAAGLERRVHLVGAVDGGALPSAYADADVFALASRHENFGMVAAEAAAVGTPVLVTDSCGVAELLADGGALVVPYDGNEVRDGLAQLLADATLRAELSAGGRVVARAWSWDRVAELEDEILRSVVAA